ncbi:hypothetical protein GJV85_12050 [Sulfurimonas aquatica]|uniref:Uncharacterized protein n=1 Tax=Sulfurimonas aquatica TaxID=2672570 RepID=A0A975GDL7_9BACT|nr:hypothetical protein [Sulfurimonas aquatica]QSZ42815.1 hypothetical protein GJV85_12050 [Sulfurimonas aquatica]
MQELVTYLHKRRIIMISAIFIIAIIGFIFHINFSLDPVTYFDGKYNIFIIYFLIIYKLIELPVLYYILMYRYIRKLSKSNSDLSKSNNNYDLNLKIKKHTKLLYFLIPQGNTVFGIIAYKVSGEILYFYLFLLIALVTLILIRPTSLSVIKLKSI